MIDSLYFFPFLFFILIMQIFPFFHGFFTSVRHNLKISPKVELIVIEDHIISIWVFVFEVLIEQIFYFKFIIFIWITNLMIVSFNCIIKPSLHAIKPFQVKFILKWIVHSHVKSINYSSLIVNDFMSCWHLFWGWKPNYLLR